jgi:toxin HigB-1
VVKFRFHDRELERLYSEKAYSGDYAGGIVKAFRMRVEAIKAAINEQDLRAMKAWRYEKLKGSRSHQHSMRLNDRYRLILERDATDYSVIVIREISDHYK